MKQIFISLLLFFSASYTYAQSPTLHIPFENREDIHTVAGIHGKALNLGDVPDRFGFAIKNPLQNEDSFTVLVWAKGDRNASAPYDILTGVTMLEQRGQGWKSRVMNGIEAPVTGVFNGWKIGMQANGAWSFTARGDDFTYAYEPMPSRQTIRDGAWHLIAVSYNSNDSELRFYYDGAQVAIYNAPALKSMIASDSLVVGNSIDSDHDYRIKQWDTFYGQLDDITIYDRVSTADEIAAYYARITGRAIPKQSETPLSVLKVTAFNIFHGGNETGKDIGRARVINLLKKENADIFTLVETYGSGELIADALGYHLYLISTNLSIVSRYPITDTHQIFRPFNAGGVEIRLPGGQRVNVFAIWLKHLPSYRAPFFEDADIDLVEYLKEEEKTRGAEMRTILKEIDPFLDQSKEVPVILGGDFNSGSHLDWTKATQSSHNNYVVPWPVSIMAAKAGLTDSYREMHPDPLKDPAVSFSILNNSKTYIRDRIDYIYYKGSKLKSLASTTIEEHPVAFPSDHGGVSTVFGVVAGD